MAFILHVFRHYKYLLAADLLFILWLGQSLHEAWVHVSLAFAVQCFDQELNSVRQMPLSAYKHPETEFHLLFSQQGAAGPLDMSLPSTPDIKIKEEEPVEVDSSPPDSPASSPCSPPLKEKVKLSPRSHPQCSFWSINGIRRIDWIQKNECFFLFLFSFLLSPPPLPFFNSISLM